ncbi:MAG: hypothetical protein A2705_00895 [Omnitrophica WOR_2 bacterium RIFCSPHIGHO2_01_FULL_52_10]|nr:MAG: hypothetical protein A2705_00895 [Omnitrophica WOR_2 bacterium RIFCSPHIGHO2_01_FULL_52_10]
MRKKMFNVLSVVFVSMLLPTIRAEAQEFSAQMISRTGKETVNAKIYVAQDKVRMEMPESVMIIRRDKNLSWMLMPADKMYMEHPVDMSSSPKVSKNFDGEIERVAMGTEAVDGQPAEKFQVTYPEKGKNVSVYQWLRGGEIPIKVEAVDGTWSMEYEDLKTGPQPADLFEVPAEYEKFAMPGLGEMMKSFGGM